MNRKVMWWRYALMFWHYIIEQGFVLDPSNEKTPKMMLTLWPWPLTLPTNAFEILISFIPTQYFMSVHQMVWRRLTDGHTHRQTNGTNSLTLIADVEGIIRLNSWLQWLTSPSMLLSNMLEFYDRFDRGTPICHKRQILQQSVYEADWGDINTGYCKTLNFRDTKISRIRPIGHFWTTNTPILLHRGGFQLSARF